MLNMKNKKAMAVSTFAILAIAIIAAVIFIVFILAARDVSMGGIGRINWLMRM